MVYAVSDLHGRYDLYLAMLEKIKLSDNDMLYVLGDYVDRGPDGFKIIFDMAERRNVKPLLGNHDRYAEYYLSRLNRGVTEAEMRELQPGLDRWIYKNGGDETVYEFRRLHSTLRLKALRLINSYPAYADISVGENKFLLCHAGLSEYEEGRELSEYNEGDFIYSRINYYSDIFTDRYLVTGHTPTALIDKAYSGRIFRRGRNIAIDCGAVFELGLGCICLDTFEEYYVK